MNKRYQVFVSSTYTDLVEERKEITQAILECDCFPAGMELFPASNQKQWAVIKKVIDESDIYLLIIAGRYGSIGVDDIGRKVSYTEMEFDYAVAQNKPIIVLPHIKPEDIPARHSEKSNAGRRRLEQFRKKATHGRMAAFWSNKDNLHTCAVNSLRKMINDIPDAIGWVRADAFTERSFVVASENVANGALVQQFSDLNDSNQFRRFEQLSYSEKEKVWNDKSSLEAIAAFVNEQGHVEKTRTVVEEIPSFNSSNMTYESSSYLRKIISDRAIFDRFNASGALECYEILFTLFNRLHIFNGEYVLKALEIYKAYPINTTLSRRCGEYLVEFSSLSSRSDVKIELFMFAKNELLRRHTAFDIKVLARIVVENCVEEEDLEWFIVLFMKLDNSLQKKLLREFVVVCGPTLLITTPKYQRKFLDFCDGVFAWNDDQVTAWILIYWLLARTVDIFTVDEVFSRLDSVNDDTFYIFMWELEYFEFEVDYETMFDLDKKGRKRLCDVIRKRNHPRGIKLIEHYA